MTFRLPLVNIVRRSSNVTDYLSRFLKNPEEIVFDNSRKDHIAFIGLNRPKTRNALGVNLIKQFEIAIQTLKNDKLVRCVVIGSLVPNVFCSGADLKERKFLTEDQVIPSVRRTRNLLQLLADLPIPTICSIDGAALGGGLELALACDMRICSDNASMGLVETRLAIIPGAGGTQRLPRLIGISKAKELMFTARVVGGPQAERLGLVNEVVAQDDTGHAAVKRGLLVAEEVVGNGPVALRMAKKAVDEGMAVSGSVKEALMVEDRCYAQVVPTADRLEGLQAFADKRKPQYQGS